MAKAQDTTSTQREKIETELKLTFEPEAASCLASHPALKPPCASAPRSERLVSTYFDTPSLELARRGLSLRIRAAGHAAFRRSRQLARMARRWLAANGNGR